jgi:hypothetical protein
MCACGGHVIHEQIQYCVHQSATRQVDEVLDGN